jgi:hypothetical protein
LYVILIEASTIGKKRVSSGLFGLLPLGLELITIEINDTIWCGAVHYPCHLILRLFEQLVVIQKRNLGGMVLRASMVIVLTARRG